MKVSDLTSCELIGLLRRGELMLKLGPFVTRIKSSVSSLSSNIGLMYADFDVRPTCEFADFHIEISYDSGLRRWIKPQVRFFFDGNPSFVPLPATQAFAMLEWGLNWCVAAHCHQYLIIHAAIIEKNGKAVMMPAPPGSGKSTLSTGLVMRGWRLLSDELALYDMQTGMVYGMARPINLKNKSIDVIKNYAPSAVLTTPMADTTKGTVALVRPPTDSVKRAHEPVQPLWIILPKYQAEAQARLTPYSKARTFMLLAEQSFNYDTHGQAGFDAVNNLVSHAHCFEFTYSQLDDAEIIFDRLLESGE